MSTISGVSSSGDTWATMKAQRSQMQAKMFSKVDTDSSGSVDTTELQSLINDVAKKSGVTNSSSTDELFSKMDTNSDGNLSTDELGTGMKEILPPPATLDFAQSRSDNTTQRDQGPQGAGGPPPPPPGGAGGTDADSNTTFDPLDTNQDGTVSEAERLAGSTSTDAVQTLLKAIDTDGDSQISATESDAFMTELTSQLESTSSSAENTSTTSNNDNLDLVKLVQQAYEQIANGLAQQNKGSRLSATA